MNLLTAEGLDLSRNTALRVLDCSGNNALGRLDVTHNPELERLHCKGARLSGLDVTHNPKLVYLNCYYTEIPSLDVSKNAHLEYLSCGCNAFVALDLSGNPALKNLECTFARIPALDLSGNPALEQVDLRCGVLAELDVRANRALRSLHVQYNPAMSSLDVTQNTELRSLCTAQNPIEHLDVSKLRVVGYPVVRQQSPDRTRPFGTPFAGLSALCGQPDRRTTRPVRYAARLLRMPGQCVERLDTPPDDELPEVLRESTRNARCECLHGSYVGGVRQQCADGNQSGGHRRGQKNFCVRQSSGTSRPDRGLPPSNWNAQTIVCPGSM